MIDPNPTVREIPDEQLQTPKPVTRPETVVPPPPAEQQDQDQQAPPQSDRETPPVQPLWLQILLAALPWVLAALGLIAVLLAPFAGILLVKRLRRRRRRRADTPRARIVGAWDEYVTPSSTAVTTSIGRPPAARRWPVHRARAVPGWPRSLTGRSSGRTTPTPPPRTGCGRRPTRPSRVSGPAGTDGSGSGPRCRSGPCASVTRRGRGAGRCGASRVAVRPPVRRVRGSGVTTMACRPPSAVGGRVRTGPRDQMRTLRIDTPGRSDLLR